jgi:hypothetical protein
MEENRQGNLGWELVSLEALRDPIDCQMIRVSLYIIMNVCNMLS